MIVQKPISVKIKGQFYRLNVGKTVPAIVVDFLTDNGSIKDLIKQGAISEEKQTAKKSKEITEEKIFESIQQNEE